LGDIINAPNTLPSRIPIPTEAQLVDVGSRKQAIDNFYEFINASRTHKNCIIGTLKGEWGAGKSKFMEEFAKKLNSGKDELVFLLRTSTVANIYEQSEWLSREMREGYKCLSAMIYAALIEDDNEEIAKSIGFNTAELKKKTPENSPNDFVMETLQKIRDKGIRKVFLFSDEFEEILGRKEEIRTKIISGIKGIIDKKVKIISEGGRFEGLVHILLGCTDEAWIELLRRPEIRDSISGALRRGTAYLIELRKLSPQEVFQLICNQLKHDYGTNNFTRNPFNAGSLYALYRASLGNAGALMQLYVVLMEEGIKRAKEKGFHDKMQVIDYEIVLDALSNQKVVVEGEETICLRDDVLRDVCEEIRRVFDKETASYLAAFKLLTGELKSFSAEEVSRRLGVDYSKARKILNRLKGLTLSSVGGIHPICGIQRLNADKLKIKESISDLIRIEGNIERLKYGDETIEVNQFLESIVQYTVDGANIKVEGYYIPENFREFAEILGVSDDMARELSESLRYLVDEQNKYYKLSKKLMDLLYPPSLPEILPFIKDSNDRRKVFNMIIRNWATIEGERWLQEGIKEIFRDINLI